MKKTPKLIFPLAAGVVIVLIAGLFLAEHLIRGRIERGLSDARLGHFRLTCEEVHANIFRKSVTLDGIHIRTEVRHIPPDSLLDTPVQFLDVRIGQVSLSGITLKGLKNKEYDFTALTIDSPKGTIVTRRMPPDSTAVKTPNPWNRLNIGQLSLRGGTLDWRRIIESDTLQCTIGGLEAALTELRIDSSPVSRRRVLFSEKASIRMGSVRYTFQNQSYTIALDSLRWGSGDPDLFVSAVELIPRFSKWDFPRKSVRKSDYLQLGARGFTVVGFDADRLWNEKTLSVDSIHLAAGQFTSSKDHNAAVPVRTKPMIHTMIQRLGIQVDVRKIRVENFDIAYEETALHRTTPGRVTFERIDLTVDSLTNVVRRPGHSFEVRADTRLMGAGRLNAVFSLPVDPANDRFEVQAVLQTTPLRSFNGMIIPLAGVEIQSGTIDRMDFHMAGSGTSAQVAMTLRYRDLKLELLKRTHGVWREREGLSNLVNWALIRPDNPDNRGLRSAQEVVRRDSTRSAFNYLWKGVSAGALETAETGIARRLIHHP
jgi:hypothetical protein